MQIEQSKRASATPVKTGTIEREPISPPPLPPTSASENAATASTDALRAPTLRPPAAPAQPPRASASPPAASHPEGGGLGFTSVIRHLSLRGWLRWIYSSRSDAALRVRTREGGTGNIWCHAGEIVDADWGPLLGETALHEMLGLSTGAVTIDFDPVERPRRILRPMRELLYALGPDSTSIGELARAEVTLPDSASGASRDTPVRGSLFTPLAAPVLHARQAAAPRRVSRAEYVCGGLLLAALVLVAFAFGRLRGSSEDQQLSALEPERAQQTKSGLLPPPAPGKPQAVIPSVVTTPRELPVIPFATLEVEPANGEIWLDQALVGLGRLELAPIPDGALHELRFVSAGYETRSLYFVGTPPSGRVLLERAAQSPAQDDEQSGLAREPAEAAAASGEGGGPHLAAKSAPRHRLPVAAPPVKGRERSPEATPSGAKAAQGKVTPQIQLIETHAPRVQVLD